MLRERSRAMMISRLIEDGFVELAPLRTGERDDGENEAEPQTPAKA